MTVVQSGLTLTDMETWWPLSSTGSLTFYDQYNYDYATIYRTQPNVRTCVDFLSRNIAQLGLHVFRRVSDTDRQRLTDHPLARVLARPLPEEYKVTYYRLVESLMGDLGIYFNAYWLKIRVDGASAGLLRIPPIYVTVKGGLVPTEYKLNLGGEPRTIKPSEIVHFRGYNPGSAISGLAPLETLRRILAEEHAAGDYREGLWQNAAKMYGIIKRPAGAPKWSDLARQRFKNEFAALYSPNEQSGTTAILEEGMEWQSISFNAQESQYLAGRKLTREECARAYHIAPTMVGILEHATFSNITEQHKNLYQDTLGPWLAMIEQDIELQLLPEFGDTAGVYVEFNIAEKLKGSFDEQVKALQSAVGRPWMEPNEARARMNLPSRPDGDGLAIPLNVLIGGQASPRDSAPDKTGGKSVKIRGLDTHLPLLRQQHEKRWVEVLSRHYRRQEAAMLSRAPEAVAKTDIGGVWWDDDRWNNELTDDLLRLNLLTAGAWANEMATAMETEVSEERMLPWLQEHARIQAEYINERTRGQVEGALTEPDPKEAIKTVFTNALTVWAVREAVSAVTTASNFGAHEAANAAGLRSKTWRVNSTNPRDEHLALNGETVGIREPFSNGMRWPGDPRGGAENNANCMCSVEFGR